MRAPPTITPVTVFADWNCQIHAARPGRDVNVIQLCEITLKYVGRLIGKVLNEIDQSKRYDVTLRLYHGWHKGFEPSDRRKAMIQISNRIDYASLSLRPNVSIRPSISFGDFLLSARPCRLHTHLNIHIPNTLRRDSFLRNDTFEKMVDSAIASEVVDLAHREPHRWLIVAGDDDDLVPPVFIAEGVRGPQDGKVLLIRSRPPSPFLKLDEMSIQP